jgi:hypothetical protein
MLRRSSRSRRLEDLGILMEMGQAIMPIPKSCQPNSPTSSESNKIILGNTVIPLTTKKPWSSLYKDKKSKFKEIRR